MRWADIPSLGTGGIGLKHVTVPFTILGAEKDEYKGPDGNITPSVKIRIKPIKINGTEVTHISTTAQDIVNKLNADDVQKHLKGGGVIGPVRKIEKRGKSGFAFYALEDVDGPASPTLGDMASDTQIDTLKKAGIPVPENLTKSNADAILGGMGL